MNTMKVTEATFYELCDRASSLAKLGSRTILGISGAPGAGKSTFAQRLVDALGQEKAVLVPMDGFHLANEVLHDLGRHDRKGAHDTFDAWGYSALLHRIHRQGTTSGEPGDAVIYAPIFRRDLEEPVGSAIPIHRETPLVVTEGNYLLHDDPAWRKAREVIDEVWFLAPSEEQRVSWLIERHMKFGRSLEQARQRSFGSDQQNAQVISATAVRADLVVRLCEEAVLPVTTDAVLGS